MKPVIYKITSPNKRIYIGQTINHKIRFRVYRNSGCPKQKKLQNSFNKYGVNNHVFEIICECEVIELNDKERYYQDLYNSTNKFGLNIRLTTSSDRIGTFSEETKLKMSLAKRGVKRSPDVCKAISERMKITASKRTTEFYDNFKKANIGRKHSAEHVEKNRKAKLGNTCKKGSKLTDEQKNNIRRSKIGNTYRKNSNL